MFSLFVILPIGVGTGIYVGWRSTSLLVFGWMATCGVPQDFFRQTANLPHPLLYSLPDGCWVFAGTSCMLMIWRRLHAWVFVFVALAICTEFGQAVQVIPGTFEWNDITFYVSGFFLPMIGYKYAKTRPIHNIAIDNGCPRFGKC